MSLLLLLGSQPYHPEVLHQHVRHLEWAYASILAGDTNGREAVAKAIVMATSSFVEGCLHQILRQHIGTKVSDGVLVDDLLDRFRSIETKMKYAKKRASLFGGKWLVPKDNVAAKFVKNRVKQGEPSLPSLRNAIAHGDKVKQADLKLDDVAFFRRAASEYLEWVYASFGDQKPGWLA